MDYRFECRIHDSWIRVRVRFLGDVVRQMQRAGQLIHRYGGTARAPPARGAL
jgi:hypothetical protein